MPGARFSYQPYPEVEPTGAPGGDYMNIQASPAAFGAQVGQAEQGFGKELESVGSQTTQTGFMLMNQYNHVGADDASNGHQKFIYNSLNGDPNDPSASKGFLNSEGADAMSRQAAAFKAIDDDRNQRRAQMRSPEMMIQYDEQTRRMDQNALSQIGSHARQQQQVWARGVVNGTVDNDLRAVGQDPFNDRLFQEKLQHSQDAITRYSVDHGEPEQEHQSHLDVNNGKFVLMRVQGMEAQGNPKAALDFLDAHKTALKDPQVYNTTKLRLQGMAADQGVRETRPEPSIGDTGQRTLPSFTNFAQSGYGHAVGRMESSNDYSRTGPIVQSGPYAGDKGYGRFMVMGRNVPQWTQEALGKSMTPQEFLADHKAQDAVFDYQTAKNVKKFGSLEDAASVWHSGRPLAQAAAAGAHDQNISTVNYVKNIMSGVGGATPGESRVGFGLGGAAIQPAPTAVASGQGPTTDVGQPQAAPSTGMGAGEQPAFSNAPTVAAPQQQPVQTAPALPDLGEWQRRIKEWAHGDPELERIGIQRVDQAYSQEHLAASAAMAAQTRNEKMRQQAIEDQSEAEQALVYSDIYNPAKTITARDIADNPRMTMPDKIRMNAALKSEQKGLGYGPAYNATWKRLHLPDGDPNKITSAAQIYDMAIQDNSGLYPDGAKDLVKELDLRKTGAGMAESEELKAFKEAAQAKLSGESEYYSTEDPKGKAAYLNFLLRFNQAYEKARKGDDKNPPLPPEELLQAPDKDGKVGKNSLWNMINPYLRDPAVKAQDTTRFIKPPESDASEARPGEYKDLDSLMRDYSAGKIPRGYAQDYAIKHFNAYRKQPQVPAAPAPEPPVNP